jgi:hypothetical protein
MILRLPSQLLSNAKIWIGDQSIHARCDVTHIQISDARQSLSWADHEASLLKSEIDDFFQRRPYSVEAKPGEDNTGGEILLEILKRPDLVRWTRRVGDILGYLRAALNYATYQIALADCPAKADRVEFPIFSDPATFQNQNRAKDFAPARLSLIESVQPYPQCQGL